jgi:hypothetical protein
MKVKAVLNKFLTNKWVLNIVCVIAILNIIGYAALGKYNEIVYFVLFAVLIRFFSKNMIIVLGIPVILVSLLASKQIISEGMKNNTEQQKKSNDNKNTQQNTSQNTKKESMNNKKSSQDKKTNQGLPITPLDSETTNAVSSDEVGGVTDESFEVGRGKRRIGAQIDYASTIEDAYDELNKILGSDGVKRLTDDTQNLMKQQMQLAESMNSMKPLIQGMAPMLETAKSLMKGMGDNKDDINNVLQMSKQLNIK